MTLIDTHCHLDFKAYDDLRADIIQQAAEAGVTRIVNPTIDLASARTALALAETFGGVYVAVGLHPNSTADFQRVMAGTVKTLADHPKAVAIGEIGLDYYRDHSPPETQRRAFAAQLAVAADLALPVIIHNRDADDDVMDMLADWVLTLPESVRARPGVLHSFSASEEIAERGLALGFYLGFTGPVTFQKADELRRIAIGVPDDRILVETDGPFLTPHPYRGKFPNRPAYVRYVAERLAVERGVSFETFAAQTTANAVRLFQLGSDHA
jgi:TatD DNase family protein